MPPIDAVFNANEVKPIQFGGGAHPIGNKFPFTITNTSVEPTKDGQNGKFVVELTSGAGSIRINFNLFHSNDQTRNIAKGQLTTLCNAVGIFTVDFKNEGASLRGGVGLMDIGFQKGQEPSAEKPEGGYVEVKKIYDKNGNDPTQGGSGQQQASSGFAQQNTQQQQPNNQQPNNGNWNANAGGDQQQSNTIQQPNVQQGWNNGGQQNNQPNPNQNQQQQQGGWQQQQGDNGNVAPWQK